MRSTIVVLAALLALAGCASFDGSSLVAGKSTEAEVVGLMGQPSDVRPRAEGGKSLYFSRLPFGRAIFKATIGPDGTLRGIEQTLTDANILQVRAKTTKEDVRDLIGPPYRTSREPRMPWETWEYPWLNMARELRVLWVSFSDDGLVRQVVEQHDYIADPPTGPAFP